MGMSGDARSRSAIATSASGRSSGSLRAHRAQQIEARGRASSRASRGDRAACRASPPPTRARRRRAPRDASRARPCPSARRAARWRGSARPSRGAARRPRACASSSPRTASTSAVAGGLSAALDATERALSHLHLLSASARVSSSAAGPSHAPALDATSTASARPRASSDGYAVDHRGEAVVARASQERGRLLAAWRGERLGDVVELRALDVELGDGGDLGDRDLGRVALRAYASSSTTATHEVRTGSGSGDVVGLPRLAAMRPRAS